MSSRRRFHVALGVLDIESCIADYTARFECPPVIHIPGEYALWRTDEVNFSIRRSEATGLRHVGWEDPSAAVFSSDADVNGIVWERFSAKQQNAEIQLAWPNGDRLS